MSGFSISHYRLDGLGRPAEVTTCPKCGKTSGDDWSQCGGVCPMEGSPHYDSSWFSSWRAEIEEGEWGDKAWMLTVDGRRITTFSDKAEATSAKDRLNVILGPKMQPAQAGEELPRYHLTEPSITIDGKVFGKGWLLISEEEYAEQRQHMPPRYEFAIWGANADGEVPREPKVVKLITCNGGVTQAKRLARSFALEHLGPVDIARAGPEPWKERAIGTMVPKLPGTGSRACEFEEFV